MSGGEILEDFFSRLKQERENHGKSLEDVFAATRISLVYLKAIEEGDLKKLPKSYDRIFMKSYLMAIGADVELFLADFDRLLGRREPTQLIDLDDLDRQEQTRELTLNQGLKHALLWTPVAVIVTFLIYLFFTFGGEESGADEVSGQIPEIKVEDYINSIDTSQSAIEAPAEEKSDSLFLSLKGLRKTWVRAVIDHRDTLEFILPVNASKDIAADSVFTFVMGKGNGVEIQVNDSTYSKLTPPGQVIKRLEIDRNGIRKLIYSPPVKTTSNQ